MQIDSVSNQNFKAKVSMDLRVQNAYKQIPELKKFVKFLEEKVKCPDVYLSTKPVNGWRGFFDQKLIGQSVHTDGKIYDSELGMLWYDDKNKKYSFVADNIQGFMEKDPYTHFNYLLHTMKLKDNEIPLNVVV